jgi:hypothetical protein
VLGRSRQRGKLVLSAQSLCPDILGMLNLSQPFGLGADPLAVDLRPPQPKIAWSETKTLRLESRPP